MAVTGDLESVPKGTDTFGGAILMLQSLWDKQPAVALTCCPKNPMPTPAGNRGSSASGGVVRPCPKGGTAGDFANGVKGLLATDNNQFLRNAVGTGTFGGGNLPYMR
jgi:hypothetical protein